MIKYLKNLLMPLASLKLTIVLLVMSMILVLAGTTAQRDMDVHAVQDRYFHCWLARIAFHDFQGVPSPKPGHEASEAYVPGHFYFPGGYLLISIMLANLLAAHTVRFKFRTRRIGIILIHGGLIMLLLGEVMTSVFAVESNMRIDVGGSAVYSEDTRFPELAVIDQSAPDHDQVTVIPLGIVRGSAGKTIHDSQLPFDIKVEKFYDNSMPVGPQQAGSNVDRLATSGPATRVGIVELPKVTGAGAEASMIDSPSAFVTFYKDGKSLGTYLVSLLFDRSSPYNFPGLASQIVHLDGRAFTVALRNRRYYKPYKVELKDFSHETVPGTDIAKNFASTVRLIQPDIHVDREAKISMNNPLRFNGETFYQYQAPAGDRSTVLQVVRNPAWTWPYIACAVGTLGLVIHFSMILIEFLRRKLAPTPGTVGALSKGTESTGTRVRYMPPLPPDEFTTARDRYRLAPQPAWMNGIPAVAIILGLLVLGAQLFNSSPTEPYNFEGFSRLPIFIDGRVQPLDSTARNMLNIISAGHYQSEFPDQAGKKHPAIEWLADVMTRSHHWADDKVIRIDNQQVKELLGLKVEANYFSWSDVGLEKADVREKLDHQEMLARDVPDKDRDAFQNGILELHQRLGIYIRLLQVDALNNELEMASNPEKAAAFEIVRKELMRENPDLSRLTAEQRSLLEKRSLLAGIRKPDDDDRLRPESQLLLIPPTSPGGVWQPIVSILDTPETPESALVLLKIARDYGSDKPVEFNADVAAYQARLSGTLGRDMDTVNSEVALNHFNPFYQAMVFYVLIFLTTFISWLCLTRPLWRTAYGLMLLAFVVHTVGLVLRIYISGRPPVTNLYSGAVFIGWAIALFSLGLDAIFRNGIGLVAGSTAGFISLLVAGGFAAGEGDTMRQLQAVLDTNFWLATHVVCVTMGYMATVLAGVLSIIYIVRGIGDPSFAGETGKDTSRMIYGIVCFGLLFSFVGTILGGIWADQSWGRFWGWDPKENGAVLVVLWNAVILHARWAGVVKDRGVAQMAILGNIVVGWSFVGTNLLGIGLHSYGFMSGQLTWLLIWVAANLLLAAVGFVPRQYWAINPDIA